MCECEVGFGMKASKARQKTSLSAYYGIGKEKNREARMVWKFSGAPRLPREREWAAAGKLRGSNLAGQNRNRALARKRRLTKQREEKRETQISLALVRRKTPPVLENRQTRHRNIVLTGHQKVPSLAMVMCQIYGRDDKVKKAHFRKGSKIKNP